MKPQINDQPERKFWCWQRVSAIVVWLGCAIALALELLWCR